MYTYLYMYLRLSLNSTVNEDESLSLVSALIAPTDCTVLSLGVSAELGQVWEEESVAGHTGTGNRDNMELGINI